jgi:hypothetical protein
MRTIITIVIAAPVSGSAVAPAAEIPVKARAYPGVPVSLTSNSHYS